MVDRYIGAYQEASERADQVEERLREFQRYDLARAATWKTAVDRLVRAASEAYEQLDEDGHQRLARDLHEALRSFLPAASPSRFQDREDGRVEPEDEVGQRAVSLDPWDRTEDKC